MKLSYARVLVALLAPLGLAPAAAQTAAPPIVSAQRTVALPSAHLPPTQQLRFPNMAPGDSADVTLNIAAYLNDAHDTVASFTAQVDAGNASDLAILSQDQVNGSLLTIWLSAGTTIADHSILFHVITAGGRTINLTAWLRVLPVASNGSITPPVVVGPPGHSSLVGVGAPTSSIGISGDSYTDSSTGEIWKKSLSGWADTGTTLPTTAAETARAEAAEALLTPLTNPLLTGALQGAQNLADLPNKPQAMVNLGAYPASNPAGFATAAQAAAAAPVQSFNSRTGQINLTAPDVNAALGFIPYSSNNPAGYITSNQTVTLSGDVTGSGKSTITVTLPSVNASGAGTFGTITVDAKGRILAIRTPAGADISAELGFTPASAANLSAETTRATAAEAAISTAVGAAQTKATQALSAATSTTFAPLSSPALVGTPTAPTATLGTNTTQLSTTAFANAAVAAETGRAQAAENGLASSTAATYAPLNSPLFRGNPVVPTAPPATNSQTAASTAYADAAVGVEKSRAQAAEASVISGALSPSAAAALYAPLISPAMTGTPTVPTAAANTSTTQAASTAFTGAAVGVEKARALAAESSIAAAITGAQSTASGALQASTAATTYAPLNSPAFGGTPTGPTAAPGASTTQLATTAFSTAGIGTETTRAVAAEAAIRSLAQAALPAATAASTYAPIASPTFSGTPNVPTASPGTSTTQAASTAFAGAAVSVGVGQANAFSTSAVAAEANRAKAAEGSISTVANAALPAATAASTYAPLAGTLRAANNLSDVASPSAALGHLGGYPASNPAGYITPSALPVIPNGQLLGGNGSTLSAVSVGSTLALAGGALGLPTVNASPGAYSNVTVDAQGRVTAARPLASGDITPALISGGALNLGNLVAGGIGSPTVEACGTGASLDAGSSDLNGAVQVGASVQSCTLAFAVPAAVRRTCTVTDRSGGYAVAYSPGLTALVVTQPYLGGSKFDYACSGY